MAKKIGPLDIYNYLPKTNCGECGEKTCMAFASQLIERAVKLEDCPTLKQPNFAEKYHSLKEMLAPGVKEVIVGVGDKAVKTGGEEIIFRHELTYFNKTAIALDVHDEMNDEELVERVRYVNDFCFKRIGEELKLDIIAIRSTSNDPDRFAQCVSKVLGEAKKPLILCSWTPSVLEEGLKVAGHERPLIYAATRDTWEEVGRLAVKYNCPVVAFADDDMAELKSVVKALESVGAEDIVLDPGSHVEGKYLANTFGNFVASRRAAIWNGDIGYPLLGVPATVWLSGGDASKEAMIAAIMIDKYADLIILHTPEIWALLPVITLRQNIYTDPRKPVAVEAGLRRFGDPDENAPVLMTTNFALTYYTVASDLESAGVDCYLLVIDTEGLGVEASVAGGKLDAFKAKEAIKNSGVEKEVIHRKIIIPGFSSRISGDLEIQSGWEVLVGPRDSSGIEDFIEKKWSGQA
ncbi:MAG: acetyl-CoA decarbonylase/synthase complex subunit gamma [Methanocellales archaeon]|nr:acetyl-CoA decarbonylase/synthase complex subunit gamma [Methanocellales archaeon]MDD3292268.1 acetyl-CoA decarbonylase/synthase complex subunit gamma [Methanocellales archaeon]MDD5485846.1 acetyl-CoA decarbonylase/synthase complex subunit gamma [Methanocellales archaeon]